MSGQADRDDAARFRWLCDERGLSFSLNAKGYGICMSAWGDWPTDLRDAIDVARNALVVHDQLENAERELRSALGRLEAYRALLLNPETMAE
jgi:hypothetical protein